MTLVTLKINKKFCRVAYADAAQESETGGGGMSVGGVVGLVISLLLVAGGVVAGVMATRWYLGNRKRRQRQNGTGSINLSNIPVYFFQFFYVYVC
jgi:hypothetical protein